MIKTLVPALVILALVCLAPRPSMATEKRLFLATTTSTDNTGLLDYLESILLRDTGIHLLWVSVGTGKALELGRNCDVDVLLVHDPEAEETFIAQGYGINRRRVMYNDFVLIGPVEDPARVAGKPIEDALELLASRGAAFASRGDNSGTHMKELFLWRHAGLPVPEMQSWYIQAGQGMLATIQVAQERDAYTLTDRGTFIKYEDNWNGDPPLVILVQGGDILVNQYSVITINPERCETAQYELAEQFSHWIVSPSVQSAIGEYRLREKGLFIPNAGSDENKQP